MAAPQPRPCLTPLMAIAALMALMAGSTAGGWWVWVYVVCWGGWGGWGMGGAELKQASLEARCNLVDRPASNSRAISLLGRCSGGGARWWHHGGTTGTVRWALWC